jgi:uncharacterized membrane protein (DUF2068 family)
VDWSLIACGRSGHVTYAPDEPELRKQLSASGADGESWRCLRCASFVIGEPGSSGPAISAPRVRRGKEIRSALILRIFAVERFLRALILLVAAYGLWRFNYARQSIEASFDRELPIVRELFRQLGYNIDHSKLVGLIQHALTLSSRSITLLAAGLVVYAVVEGVEGAGLWLTRRWGEYFAMVATSVGLPLEIYDLTNKVTATTLIFLAVNLLLVLYLVLTKRLFGARGGKPAYEARLRSDSVMEATIEAAAAAAGGGPEPGSAGERPRAGSAAERLAPGVAAGPRTEAAAGPRTETAAGPRTETAAEPRTETAPEPRTETAAESADETRAEGAPSRATDSATRLAAAPPAASATSGARGAVDEVRTRP